MKNLTKAKSIQFKLPQTLSELFPFGIELKIPELEESNFQVSGDWGPNYTFQTSDKININIKKTDSNTSYSLPNQEIKFVSPMIAKERKYTPLKLQLKDTNLGLSFCIGFNNDGDVKSAEACIIKELEHDLLS